MGKKLTLAILALAILGGVYMFIFGLYSILLFIHPNTLEFSIYNKDNVNHSVTVEIFSGDRKVFEESYIIKPELAVFKNTGLRWGEYIIKISLDGKVYRYKAKVRPGYRLPAGGFTNIAFDIKNSNLSAHIISEGPPYIEFVEFVGECSIFEKKFLFLEVCGVSLSFKPIKGEPTYHFDEKTKVPIELNESLKVIVGEGIKRHFSGSTISSYLEQIYSLIRLKSMDLERLRYWTSTSTVRLRFNSTVEQFIFIRNRAGLKRPKNTAGVYTLSITGS